MPSAGFETDPLPRDTHLLTIASLGRLGWQEVTGYGKRALVETAMGRYKALMVSDCAPAVMLRGAPKPSSASQFSTLCSVPQGPTPSAVRRPVAPA